MITTVHGKGSFVCGVDPSLKWEEQLKGIQDELEGIITKARLVGLSDQELKELMELILEES